MKHLFLCAAMSLMAGPGWAQDAQTGRGDYERYCATCHGLEARGKGPMGPSLLLQPTDLTQLAAKNEGIFPTLRVVARIDGSDPLVSHGSPMPVYGMFFQGKGVPLRTETGQMVMTSQPIVDLVAYLEGLQE